MKKTSPKVKSEVLLNIKDIEKMKAENSSAKIDQKAITIDDSLEKYNTAYIKAMEAPIPPINLHYNEVLLRAVPPEVKSKGGIILSTDSDYKVADRLGRMVNNVGQTQEILMVGDLITEREREAGLKPGNYAKLNLKNLRTMSDRHHAGMIEMEYEIPIEIIGDYKYIIVDKRDILYTIKNQENEVSS